MLVRTGAFMLGTIAALAAGAKWTATLEPVGDSGVAGTATLEAVGNDSLRATITVTMGAAGSDLTWAIHQGACAKPGPALGKAADYKPVKVAATGGGTTMTTLPLTLPAAGEHSLMLHQGAADQAVLACGVLRPAPPEATP